MEQVVYTLPTVGGKMINYRKLWRGALIGIFGSLIVTYCNGMTEETGVLITLLLLMALANIIALLNPPN